LTQTPSLLIITVHKSSLGPLRALQLMNCN